MACYSELPLDLYLVRHGQSDGNFAYKHKEYDKIEDIPSTLYRLTLKGVQEAKTTGKWLVQNAKTPDHFFCSDMVRAQETAANLGLPYARWEIDSRLREVDKLKRHEELVDSAELRLSFSFENTVANVRSFLSDLSKTGSKSAIVVSHHNTILAFKYVLEKCSPLSFVEQKDRHCIKNAQVLWYTRVNPYHSPSLAVFDDEARLSHDYNWLLNVVPWQKKNKQKKEDEEKDWIDLSGCQHLKTNQNLLNDVALFKRVDFAPAPSI
jgi:broad specificity phosphatase PhoE